MSWIQQRLDARIDTYEEGVECEVCLDTGWMAVPDVVMGGYIDAPCVLCVERGTRENAAKGSATDPVSPKNERVK